MNNTNFDIFISYKRKSLPTANNLYYRLTTRGYSTFFDLEEMGRDNFNVQLLNYIENAKDVFVILEEGSLDACKSNDWENDWFCHEIAFALEKKKNIIPILLNGYKMPSEDFFPDKLKEFSFKQAPEFNFSFFEAYLDKLIDKEYLLSKPDIQDKFASVFKFYSNENCQIYKEGKLVCSLDGMSDEPYYLPVPRKGDFRFKVVNSITEETKVIKEYIDKDEDKEIEIEWKDYDQTVYHDIFISYSFEHGFDAAKSIYKWLSREGYSVYFDESSFRTGKRDAQSIKQALQCKDFLLFVDSDFTNRLSDEDDWVRNELSIAIKRGCNEVNIIPITMNDLINNRNIIIEKLYSRASQVNYYYSRTPEMNIDPKQEKIEQEVERKAIEMILALVRSGTNK